MSADWYTSPAIYLVAILLLVFGWRLWRFFQSRERTFKTSIRGGEFTETRIVGADQAWQSLSKRRKQVARLVAKGYSNGEVAALLGITENTVDAHLKTIYDHLDVHSRTKLANRIRDFID